MKRSFRPALFGASLAAGLVLGLVALSHAVVGSISRNVVSAGGNRVSAGNVILDGTIGEPIVGPVGIGPVKLSAGYWWAVVGPLVDVPTPDELPKILRLHPAAPNPFGPSTQVGFDLPNSEAVRVTVYDIRGARIRVLAEGNYPPGRHRLSWNGTDEIGRRVPGAVYLLEVRIGTSRSRQKLVRVE